MRPPLHTLTGAELSRIEQDRNEPSAIRKLARTIIVNRYLATKENG